MNRLLLMSKRRAAAPVWNYLMDAATRVQYAGLTNVEASYSGHLGSPLTILDTYPSHQIRQFGYIRQIHIKTDERGDGQIKFKVFRPNGANYVFVSESEIVTVSAGPGTKTVDLVTPMACRPGDILGFYLVGSMYIQCSAMVSATPIKYAAGDITATNAFSSTVANLLINFNGFGISPYLAVTGDSISAGFYDWQGHEDAGPVGTITSDPWYQMRQLVNGAQLNGFEYQNFGKGAQSYSWVVSTGLPDALASGAKVILIHCGVNDINTSRTWAQVEANLDSIKTLYAASSSAELLVFDEILPWTNGTDGQADTVRLWNANLATWITANTTGPKPIKLCLCHDAMGKIRVSTGFLDDLQTTPDYDSDGVHPTALGYGQLASLALPYIKI